MKTLTKITLILTLMLLTVNCSLLTLNAAVPHLINYQGRLTDAGGTPLNGSYNLTFRIYDAETAGNLLWEETHSGVVIQKGIFSILLGSVKDLNLPFDKSYWLEIKVGNEVMSPRQRITSAGYAIRAEGAENSEKIKVSASDTTAGYLDQKVTKSIVVNSNKVELSGDSANPGSSKYYGTDSNGTKGYHGFPGGIPSNIQVFTSSGTWTRPTGVTKVWVIVRGSSGDGGTGGSENVGAGGGGGGGGYAEGLIAVSGNATVTIGAGGGTTNTSFVGNTTIQADYGVNGASAYFHKDGAGGAGGSASGGSINLSGGSGSSGSGQVGGQGGVSGLRYLGGSGGVKNGGRGGAGGIGGGGGGGSYSGIGGKGADGLVIVYW